MWGQAPGRLPKAAEPAHKPAAGYVFLCDRKTRREVLSQRLFGLPKSQFANMAERVGPETALYLWDFKQKILHGVFKRHGPCAVNVDATSFGGRFPAQVRFASSEASSPARFAAVEGRSIKSGAIDEATVREFTALLADGEPIGADLYEPNRVSIRPSALSSNDTAAVSLSSNQNSQSKGGSSKSSLAAQAPPFEPGSSEKAAEPPVEFAAGFVFTCNDEQEPILLENKVFVAREQRLDYLRGYIGPETMLFLANSASRRCLGIFALDGAVDLNVRGQSGLFDGRLPAHVPFKLQSTAIRRCALPNEVSFGPLDGDAAIQLLEDLGDLDAGSLDDDDPDQKLSLAATPGDERQRQLRLPSGENWPPHKRSKKDVPVSEKENRAPAVDAAARIAALLKVYGDGADGSAPTAAQWQRILDRDPARPLTLVNLFHFHKDAKYESKDFAGSGKEAFDRYAAVSGPALARAGGKFLLVAPFEGMFAGQGAPQAPWDLLAIGSYPGTSSLLALFEDPVYQAAFFHRTAACKTQWVLIADG